MNDDGLSPQEHAEVRDIVLAGTQRIKPAGAHRNQLVAAALALVLVGAVTGAAVSTAAILGGDGSGPVASPTATSTPTLTLAETPSPTPTPSSPPAEGIAPFADSCANALTVAEVSAAVGIEMALSDFRWRTGENRVLGGLDCFWTSAQEYASATVSLLVYPTGVVPETIDATTGCSPESDVSACAAVGIEGGVSMYVQARDQGGSGQDMGVAALELLSAARSRVTDHPLPVAASPTADWWTMPACGDLADSLNGMTAAYEISDATSQSSPFGASPSTNPAGIPDAAGVAKWCQLSAVAPDDPDGWVSLTVRIVAGGAVDFASAETAEHSYAVDVTGARAAVAAGSNDRLDGGSDVLVVTDGVNLLMVSATDAGMSPPEAFADFAGWLLQSISASQG